MSPRGGDALHAYEVETLQEKADRIRREQGLPPETEPHKCPPRPCYWHEDTDGTRYLIPGCLARINNPDLDECTCPSLDRQLTNAREELETLRRHHAGLQQWNDAIIRAVHDHRDGIEIMHTASTAVGS